jgi:Tol biopolymer transport system component
LERAVYLSWDQHILLNTKTKEILATLSGSGLEELDIDWSRDGSFVAIIAPAPTSMLYAGSPDELYIVNRNGEAYPSKLTDFLGENVVDFSTSRLLVEKPSWSPDGRFIAFWEMDNLSKNGDWGSDWRLAILDVTTKQISSYCSRSDILGVPSTPIWSPNSQQIVITGHNYTLLKSDPVFMIDIPNNIAVEIAQNAIPVGWMVSKP